MTKGVLLIALLVAPPSLFAGSKIHVDYDKSTDFSRFKTYAWVRGTPVNNPNLDLYIKSSVAELLRRKGLTETDFSKADSLITYDAATDSDVAVSGSLDPSYAGTGGVPLPDQFVWSNSTGMPASFVRKGSINFRILDKSANHVVWTGTSQGTIKERMAERLDQINKTLVKLFEHYPPPAK